jgi:GntR family transcriptional regulator
VPDDYVHEGADRGEDEDRSPTAPPCPPPRLLDQRVELFLFGRARWSVDRHDRASITSIMLGVKVDRQDPTDLHEQVAAEIRRAIADGEAKPGERLPPARDLAAVIGVNTNTVLRALRTLRDEGLLEFRRGRGISVAGSPERGAVVSRARELVRFARRHGYRREDLVRLIERLS